MTDMIKTIAPVLNFTEKTHHNVYADTDPTKVKLPPNSVVVVLGANKGIGAEIALAFAKAGAGAIFISARSADTLKATATQIERDWPSTKVHSVAVDLTKPETIKAVAEEVKKVYGRVDVVIPNGGVNPVPLGNTVGDTAPEYFGLCMDTNFVGTQAAAYHLLPLLRETKDGLQAFLPVGSTSAGMVHVTYGQAEYSISKLAQARLCEFIDMQYGSEGIFAASTHPGAVPTDLSAIHGEWTKAYLNDALDLCGAFLVWLAKDKSHQKWLGGRLLSAGWDVQQLEARKEEIVEKDLLRIKFTA